MAVTVSKKVYDGKTEHVTPRDEAERIKRTLYRTDETRLAKILPEPGELSDEDVARYQRDGYVAIEGIFSADEVEAYKAALSQLSRQRESWDSRLHVQEEPYFEQGGEARVDDPELRIRKFYRFVHLSPPLAEASKHPKLLAVLDRLIEPGHRMIQDMALLKPPFVGSEKPWHQDNAYFDWTPLGGVVGVWIALDRATVENGCMQIIPSSHLDGPSPHFHVRDCQLADQRVAVDRVAVVPLAPGGALFFSGLLHHGTPPNMSGDRRRALQFHYAAANCRRMTIDEHGELFNEGGDYAGCRDWDLKEGTSRAVLTP